jgi:hypothetical protein
LGFGDRLDPGSWTIKTKINKKTKTKRNFENMPKWEPE